MGNVTYPTYSGGYTNRSMLWVMLGFGNLFVCLVGLEGGMEERKGWSEMLEAGKVRAKLAA